MATLFTPPAICSYEDRRENFIGWKLLLMSLGRHSSGLKVCLFSRTFPEEFRSWVQRRAINVDLIELEESELLGWNVKPLVVEKMFAAGHQRVLWVDSDILITGDILPRLEAIPEASIAVTLENGTFDERRVTCHGMEVGRRFDGNLNTCLIHIHRHYHEELIASWKALLKGPAFLERQAMSNEERPIFCWSEQDVLAGLLCGKPPRGFSSLELDLICLHREIIHVGSPYRIKARLGSPFRSKPFFLHAQGLKPWSISSEGKGTLRELQTKLSLYCHEARKYAVDLEEDPSWMLPFFPQERFLNALFLGNPHLRGIPLMMAADLKDWMRRRRSVDLDDSIREAPFVKEP